MIYSMTAFARTQQQNEMGSLVCEIRSINHRYLELSLYLPEMLRSLEMPLREMIRKTIKRGKIECAIRFQAAPAAEVATVNVNMSLAQSLCRASEAIGGLMRQTTPMSPADILRFPGVIENKQSDLGSMQAEVETLLEKTINELLAARGREGEELKQLFLGRMDAMMVELAKVRERLPAVLQEARERLFKRFTEAKVELEPNRLEQEMVVFAQKIDIAEEIERTETHIAEVRRILKEGGMVGRRLDFLLQELNREANTMGSKSVDPVITYVAVEMKVLIEQVREQVQNIE